MAKEYDACIYIRVSTEAQASDIKFSLANQKEECIRYAKENGFKKLKVFEDVCSGESLERPGYIKMNEFIDKHNIKNLVVYDITRISRDSLDLITEFLRYHKKLKIGLYSVNQKKIFSTLGSDALDKYDISNLVKLLMYGLQVEYSTKMFKSRMYNGKRMSLAEGCIQNRTFGYRNRRDEGGKNMTYIYEPEAKVVRKCVELYLNGLPFSEIAQYLNKNGVQAFKFGPKYTGRIVRRLILNESYTGKFKLGEIYSQLEHLAITPIEKFNEIKNIYFEKTGCNTIIL